MRVKKHHFEAATSVLVAWFGKAGIAYATIAMTALVLIFAEVLPKTYAILNADRIRDLEAPFSGLNEGEATSAYAQSLSAVAHVPDARRPVHVHAHIAFFGFQGLAGVQTHTGANFVRGYGGPPCVL